MEIETDCETVEVASVVRAPRKLRTCPECGAEFMPRTGSQVCCSDECRAARHQRIDRECRRRARGADFDRSPRVCPECYTAFEPKRKNQTCCCAACAKIHAHSNVATPAALKAERAAKARRRAAFFASRDAAFERAGLPIPKIEERGGVRIERRGTCVGGTAFNPSVPISTKSYYYR